MEIVCKICGAIENSSDYIKNCPERPIMEKEHVCFHCAFWKHKLANRTRNTFIVNGEHYTGYLVNKAGRSSFGLGMGGADYYVKYSDGRIAHYNNVWHQGTVPDWPEFADNAVLITREEYNKLIQE